MGVEEIAVDIDPMEVNFIISSNCHEVDLESMFDKTVKAYCSDFSEGKSAFDVLREIDEQQEDFSFSYDEYDFGIFISSLNHYHPDTLEQFWAFYVNDEMSMVGVSDYLVLDGDKLTFAVEDVQF
jgi:hypothetical protein